MDYEIGWMPIEFQSELYDVLSEDFNQVMVEKIRSLGNIPNILEDGGIKPVHQNHCYISIKMIQSAN